MQLNPEQERAVNTTDGPVLIVAGAGAGKTRVITHRILNLIKNGTAPHNILAITFTNKAAKEMRDRVSEILDKDSGLNLPISMSDRPMISTFHSLGVRILRENAHIFGLTRYFTIFDRADSKRAVKQAMEDCSIDPKKFDPNAVLNRISLAKGEGISRLTYTDHTKDVFEELVANVWEKYETILHKEKALDFDDLLDKTARLLADNVAIRKHYNSIWKYIHIDEYQDTNRVQYQIARYLAEENHNICVVGDADQNIYSWRGATIENILNFEKDYPETTVILLEKNYRSTKTILDAANMVIEKNIMRKKKKLFTENEKGEKLSLLVSYTETDEARSIADTCRTLIESGIQPREIAVLYRANFQSRALEDSFIKKNIPYQLLGVRFFERKEIKDVLSYVKAALNRESFGDISRIINVPARGIGKVTLAKVLSGREDLIPAGTRAKIASFWKLLDDIKREIMEKKPSEAVKFIIQESGIESMLRKGDIEDEERLLNIQELVSVATQYDNIIEENNPIQNVENIPNNSATPTIFDDNITSSDTISKNHPPVGIEKFLENAALATDQDELTKDHDAVKLMTVHAAKGLEFNTVFIAGLEQDLFPFKHNDEKNVSAAEEEEERRLFYVALTRAKKKVFLSYAIVRTIYGAQRVSAPSEFIEDIEVDLIDMPAPQKPTGAKALFIDF